MTRHSKIIAVAVVLALLCVGAARWSEKKADDYDLISLNTPDSSRWENDVNSADHNFASKHGGSWSMTIVNPVNTEITYAGYPLLHPGKDQPSSVCLHFDEIDLLPDDSSDSTLTRKDLSHYAISGFSDEAACEKTRLMLDRQELDREKIRENAELMSTKWFKASNNLFLASVIFGGFAGAWLCLRLLFTGWLAFIRATAKAIRGD
ncbi:hypothetical protein KWI12_19780 [Citrobacter cronae]|uniref:hypothetical protein n=1 Tax=Citrobacter cronae TaxID=1748967 RepID=UPI0021CE8B48|nr:hypothetical protein [Citrobacter cronae]MCU6199099.1 hypothetical protein [Citrobacter cronae]